MLPWAVARQATLSMGFPRQEYWSGLPLPSPADLPDPGVEPTSLVSAALSGRFFVTSSVSEINSQCVFGEGGLPQGNTSRDGLPSAWMSSCVTYTWTGCLGTVLTLSTQLFFFSKQQHGLDWT